MKERPILFSAEMVRAILGGRKTQTRRVVKKTDSGRVKAVGSARNWHLDDPDAVEACPYGKPGDRLWVRETWSEITGPVDSEDAKTFGRKGIIYRSDDGNDSIKGIWKPSIFMKRWMSRIVLEVVSVRVERLNFISEKDCVSEGVSAYAKGDRAFTAKEAYSLLWEAINGPGSWDVNPWVWVIEFRRVT